MAAVFILNPYANRWKAGRRKDEAFKGAAESGSTWNSGVRNDRGTATSWSTGRSSTGTSR